MAGLDDRGEVIDGVVLIGVGGPTQQIYYHPLAFRPE
jgi:hypothetical protein